MAKIPLSSRATAWILLALTALWVGACAGFARLPCPWLYQEPARVLYLGVVVIPLLSLMLATALCGSHLRSKTLPDRFVVFAATFSALPWFAWLLALVRIID